jgi:hypothetical protein
MSDATGSSDSPNFTLALRRNPGMPANWRLRFEVAGGAFILRSRRAGVDVDGPPLAGGAVDVGPEDILDSLRLRLVDYSGSRIATYRISQHQTTTPGRWAPLHTGGIDEDGTIRLLPPNVEDELPRPTGAGARATLRASEGPPARVVKHLRRELERSRIEVETLAARVAELELLLDTDDPIEAGSDSMSGT